MGGDIHLETVLFSWAFIMDVVDDLSSGMGVEGGASIWKLCSSDMISSWISWMTCSSEVGGGGDIRLETVLFSCAFFIDIVDDLQFWDGGWGGGHPFGNCPHLTRSLHGRYTLWMTCSSEV